MALDKTTEKYGLTTDRHMATDEETLTQKELETIAALRARGAAGEITWQQANEQANAIRARHGYSIDQSGEVKAEREEAPAVSAAPPDVEHLKAEKVDLTPQTEALEQWRAEQEKTHAAAIDAATQENIRAVEQAQKEAEAALESQRAAITLEEARGKDDQALYAHLRGDRGGIGAEQYDAITAQAMKNRAALRSARMEMAKSTAGEMAALRTKGEYEKAQALLELSQEYLDRLQQLHRWGAEENLSVEKFNAELEQWAAEYAMDAEKNALNLSKYQSDAAADREKRLAESGEQLLKLGVVPSESQLEAMGMSEEQAERYIAAAAGGKKTASSSSSASSAAKMDIEGLFAAAADKGGYSWLKQKSNYTKYGLQSAPSKADYDAWAEKHVFNEADISPIAKGWASDLYKMYPTKEQRRAAIEKEYAIPDGWMTETDYYYLLHKVG